MSGKITPMMGKFIGRYLIHGNATLAAKEAGCPEASAHTTGARWLKNAKVAAVIAERRERLEERLLLTAERVDRELAKMIVFDKRDLFDEAGNPRPITDIDEVTRAAISGLDVETREVDVTGLAGTFARTVTKKFKLVDQLRAMEIFYRRRGLLTDKHEVAVTLEQLVCGDTNDSGATAA